MVAVAERGLGRCQKPYQISNRDRQEGVDLAAVPKNWPFFRARQKDGQSIFAPPVGGWIFTIGEVSSDYDEDRAHGHHRAPGRSYRLPVPRLPPRSRGEWIGVISVLGSPCPIDC